MVQEGPNENHLAGRADFLARGDALSTCSMRLRNHFIFLHAIPMQLAVPICQSIWRNTIPVAVGPIASQASNLLTFILCRLKGKPVVGVRGSGGGEAGGGGQAQHLRGAVEDVWVGVLQVGQVDQGLTDLGPLVQLTLEAAQGLDAKAIHLVIGGLAQLIQHKAQEQGHQWPS